MQVIKPFNFEKIDKLMLNMEDIILKVLKRELEKFGIKVENIARQHITKQDLDWTTLSPVYLEKKLKEGKSEKIYIATSGYLKNITSFVTKDKKHLVIGLPKGVKNQEGIEYFDVAFWLEFGTPKIPERPLWQPTGDEALKLFDDGSKGIAEMIVLDLIPFGK